MSKQPNIVFILPDQLRRDFLGCYGADFLQTPNIDRLAQGGVKYEKAISQYPICIPARAAMLTGMGAEETGVVDNGKWLRPDRREMGVETWPELLGQNGYHTAAIGKMHFVPWDHDEGFAERVISEDKRHYWVEDDYADALADRGLRKQHGRDVDGYVENKGACLNPVPDDLFPDTWVADQAIAFLQRQPKDKPFAVMVGFPSPHCPYDPKPNWLEAIDPANLPAPRPETDDSRTQRAAMIANFKQDWADVDYSDLTEAQIRTIRHHYAALVEAVDREVGRVIDALLQTEFADNTVIIFASDHGDFIGDYRLIGKGSYYGPAIDIPLIINDLRKGEGNRVEAAPVSLSDMFETLLDIAGVESPEPQARFPSLLGPLDPERRIFGLCPRGSMLVGPGFKFCRKSTGEAEAYDTDADPNEQTNIADGADPRTRDYDQQLTRALIAALSQSNNDKSYVEASGADISAFGQRGWKRPYPAKVSKQALRNV